MPQAYTTISKEQFETTLGKVADFTIASDAEASEIVYDINVPQDDLVVRIFSSIDENSGTSRGIGQDAIRCVLWNVDKNVPVGGKKKTLRIGPTDSNPHGWAGNLVPKIADLLANWRDYYHGDCHICDSGVMQLRDGKYGEFLGCSQYPRCEATRQIGEDVETDDENACPECQTGEMTERNGKFGTFLGCTNYPRCDHTENV